MSIKWYTYWSCFPCHKSCNALTQGTTQFTPAQLRSGYSLHKQRKKDGVFKDGSHTSSPPAAVFVLIFPTVFVHLQKRPRNSSLLQQADASRCFPSLTITKDLVGLEASIPYPDCFLITSQTRLQSPFSLAPLSAFSGKSLHLAFWLKTPSFWLGWGLAVRCALRNSLFATLLVVDTTVKLCHIKIVLWMHTCKVIFVKNRREWNWVVC